MVISLAILNILVKNKKHSNLI